MTDVAQVNKPTKFLDYTKNPDYDQAIDYVKPQLKYPEILAFKSDDINLDTSTIGQAKQVSVRYRGNGIITEGTYASDGQWIVAEKGFKDNDKTPSDSPARVPVNEMQWQSFAGAAKANTKNLKVVFLMDIRSKGFWQITKQNYAEANMPLTQIGVWAPGTAEETARFKRYLGSDNINGKILQFTNHHGAIGDKQIVKVITIPKQAEGSNGRLTAALVLG